MTTEELANTINEIADEALRKQHPYGSDGAFDWGEAKDDWIREFFYKLAQLTASE